MTVRTARLASGSTGTANVTVTAYTCPAGKTAIVKTAYIANVSGTAMSTIAAVASGAATVNLRVSSLAANDVMSLDSLYLVMEPGDEFVINANQTNGAKYWLSGVELQGIAP